MKITILYDNDAWDQRLEPDWGFAALIEASGRTILFDTGAKGPVLLKNMRHLGISPECIEEVFISHNHWDHTGGLHAFLEQRPVRVYLPGTISGVAHSPETISVSAPVEIHDRIYSTGTLKGIEQSLCIRHNGEAVVIVGCAHPGVETILSAASGIGRVTALIGGLHGFSDFPAISSLHRICATHCTRHKREIASRFPGTAITGGAGKVIEI